MEKADVVKKLSEIADLLEIGDANTFEIMAYRNASRSLDEWDGDLVQAIDDGTLTDVRSVGEGIAQTITELVRDGRSSERDRICEQFPEGLPELLQLRGIGPKKVRTLWRELDVDSIDALEEAARTERVRTLKGFGAKTEEGILSSIARLRDGGAQASTRRRERASTPRTAPKPIVGTGRLLVGTSGYAYKEWKGSFYPESLKTDDYLQFYASRFATVEINNSFYRFPLANVLENWGAQTPTGFQFAVKANQRITHRYRLKDVEDVTSDFVERCQVLGDRLGAILFQLPPNFPRDDERLTTFLDILPTGGRYAIEFRHKSWLDDRVFDRLTNHNVALVVQDDESLGMPRRVTADFTYVRLRRDEYSNADLDTWEKWLQDQAKHKRDALVFLKHDEGGTSPESVLGRWQTGTKRPALQRAASVKKRRATKKAKKKA